MVPFLQVKLWGGGMRQQQRSKPFICILLFVYLLCTLTRVAGASRNVTSSSPFDEIVGPTLYKWSTGDHSSQDTILELSTAELLAGKDVVALYFSAHWCGPCRQFTPVLSKFYKDMLKKGKKFEIIWASSDRSEEEFFTYFLEMPWLSVPLDGNKLQAVAQIATERYALKGIPHLVILDGLDASIYTTDGRSMVLGDEYGLQFPWRPRSIMNVVPRGIRTYIRTKVDNAKQRVREALGSVIAGILALPRRLAGHVLSIPGKLLRLPVVLIKRMLR